MVLQLQPGVGVEPVWKRLIAGESGIGAIQAFDTQDLPAKVAGQVPAGTRADGRLDLAEWIPVKDVKKMDRFIHLALVAAQEAVDARALVAYGDLMRTPTKERLAAALARTIHEDLTSPAGQAFERAVRLFRGLRIQPTMQVDPSDGSLRFWFQPGRGESDIDATIERLLELLNHDVLPLIPEGAYAPVTGDDKAFASTLRKRNREEEKQLTLFEPPPIDLAEIAQEFRRLGLAEERTPYDVWENERAYQKLRNEDERVYDLARACDLWTAAYFLPLRRGDDVTGKGVLALDFGGPVIHWTHHDPRFRHDSGFIQAHGRMYE